MHLEAHTEKLHLIVLDQVLEILSGHAQHGPMDTEAGGVLVGHFPESLHTLNITRVTTPQRGDRRSRCHFHRSAAPHMRLVHSMWEESQHTLNYAGEWHTHPEASPTPSGMDLRFWREAVDTFTYPGESLVFIIVGTLLTRGWTLSRGQAKPELIFETATRPHLQPSRPFLIFPGKPRPPRKIRHRKDHG